ncbi:MAG TPA: fasciclin domain-containing protein [Actinocrinis sp.]|nr:fasciclin domain-containing protein [Actinocrinis sp.]
MSAFTPRRLSAAIAAFALAGGLAACSSSSGQRASGSGSSSTAASPMASDSPSMAAAAGADFGSACSAVPASGAGSFTGMAQDPVATAASNNPVLSTLVSAVKAAGLVDTLNSAQGITVFAPTNDAFKKIPSSTLNSVLADKAQLTKILTYHVVSGRLSPDQLAGTHTALNGGTVTVTGSGANFTVTGGSTSNTASVVCGNVQTANATVYIIDSVLMPAS